MKNLFDRVPAWLWAIALFAVALVPRLFALERYVTPDEPNWVYRTVNFGEALARRDWAGTAQAGHPGVTTMWLGTLGIALERAFNPVEAAGALSWLSRLDRLSSENVEAFRRIGALLDGARLPVLLVNALGVAGAFLMARRLFGQAPAHSRRGQGAALCGAFLLALDPFAAGLSGLLHVDGLLATLSTLSVLALVTGTSKVPVTSLAWFALAGAFAGLALLSKSPALFLIPFALVVVIFAVITRRISLSSALRGLFVFFALLAAFFVALYPAMWSDPSAALDVILERASHHATSATRPTFFDGQAELNHGAGFYLAALAYRLSPIALAGVGVAIFALVRSPRTRQARAGRELDAHGCGQAPAHSRRGQAVPPQTPGDESRFAAAALLLYAVLFVVPLIFAAKKFDRYLLPIVPPLTFVAAWGFSRISWRPARESTTDEQGFSRISRLLARKSSKPRMTQLAQMGFVGFGWRLAALAIVVLQALLLLSVAPYPLMAYNPLLGGAAGARHRIAVGWGEGFGAAAAWIADNDPGAVIATGGLSNTAPVYEGKVVTIDDAGLASADYIVYTLSEAQLFPDFFASLAGQGTLTETISMGGVDAAWVVANTQAAQQAEAIRGLAQPGDAILLDAATPLARLLGEERVTVLPSGATPESISAALEALRDSTAAARIVHVTTDAASPVVRRNVRDWLAANARPVYEASAAGATIRVYEPDRASAGRLDPFAVQFDGVLALIGLEPRAAAVAYPDDLVVAARWLALGQPTTSYSATLELTDAYGDTWAKFGGPLRSPADLTPVHWQPGEIAEQVFSLRVPPELAPGDYRLRLGVERPDGNRVGLVSASGVFSGAAPLLAGVRIDPAQPSFEPGALNPGQRVSHVWPDRVELIGMDLLSSAVGTGDQFLATMHWRSLRDKLDPATELRWSLVPETPAGDAQAFAWVTRLVPNTDAALFDGDVVSARYAARLPRDLPAGRYRLLLTIDGETWDAAPIDVWHRDRDFEPPDTAVEVGALGPFDILLIEPLPDQIRAEGSLHVRLALRANDEVSVNYTLFVHLVDSDGRVAAQVDTWPQGGSWPTASLVRGQVVEDELALDVPDDAAPGTYRLAAGMYNELDGTRLPAVQNGRPRGDRLWLGPIRLSE